MSAGAADDRSSMLDLSKEEASSLQLIDLYCDYRRQRGKKGHAPVWNYKKMSVIRAEWRRVSPDALDLSPRARAALHWFKHDHPTYGRFYREHQQVLERHRGDAGLPWYISTPRLLMDMDGVEVAARPILYPHFAFGDSDLRSRIVGTHVSMGQTLSIKASVLRKCLSRCAAYSHDVLWLFLLHDIIMARNVCSMVALAERRGLPPESLASKKQQTEGYWRREQDCHCDIVRQMRERCADQEGHPDLWTYCRLLSSPRSLAYPNVFLTIAPCEWKFPLLHSMLDRYKHPEGGRKHEMLSDVGGIMALHIYNCLMVVTKKLIASNIYWREVLNYVIRVEYQGRGIEYLMYLVIYYAKSFTM